MKCNRERSAEQQRMQVVKTPARAGLPTDAGIVWSAAVLCVL